jgi:diguanylate cyclase (GGDEF)-like protein
MSASAISIEAHTGGEQESLKTLTSSWPVVIPEKQSAKGDLLWRLATTLPSTLEADEVIRLFGTELARLMPYDQISYHRPGQAGTRPNRRVHYCRYELNLLGRSLGELVIARRRPFSTSEIELIESILCVLIYPLRNALLYEQALKTALKDPVTGINNRAALNAYLEHRLSECARHAWTLSLIMLDIDRFKTMNDHYGHLAGDAVLAAVAGQMIACTRSSDSVFRYGGEEFAIVLSNTPAPGARLLAERLRRRIESTDVSLGEHSVRVTISAGVAEYRSGDTSAALLNRADERLYAAKSAGRNRVM